MLTSAELSFFMNSLVSARDSFGVVAKAISKEYGIGRRGPWMIGMIKRSSTSPNELASVNRVGRSLITAELNLLQQADLIYYQKSSHDGRRIELSLTPKGEMLYKRLSDDLSGFFQTRLASYSREQILACAELLHDFSLEPNS